MMPGFYALQNEDKTLPGILMFVYSEKVKKISIKEIMIE